jgi:hypothetical protein
MRWARTFIVAAFLLVGSDAGVLAEENYPVFVTVVGQGDIRFILANGRNSSCERGGFFDGWLAPGTYRFDTRYTSVCYRYTSGYFRELNWSVRYTAPTVIGLPAAPRPIEIIVNTD